MLKLCEPFLDASMSKKDKLDARYVLQGGRLDFRYGAVGTVLLLCWIKGLLGVLCLTCFFVLAVG